MTTLDEPLVVFDEEITEVVGTVTWSGGEVGPGEFTEFGFSARTPDQPTTLEFPAIQTYDSGEVIRWIGLPDSEEPAALVRGVDIGAEEGEGSSRSSRRRRRRRMLRRRPKWAWSSDGSASGWGRWRWWWRSCGRRA